MVKKNVSQTDQCVTTFFIKKCHLKFKEGSPPQIAPLNYQGSHCIDKCMIFIIHPYSMYRFLQLILDGTPATHPRKKTKARGGREEDTSKHPETKQ